MLICKQIDVDGLNISVTEPDTQPKPKGKKGKAEARELIVDAHLRLKTGVHYGFIGRNGTGKSSKHPIHRMIEAE